MLTKTSPKRKQVQIRNLLPNVQDLDPQTGGLVPSVAAPSLRITGSGPHGSDSTSSSGSDSRPPPASPVLMDRAPYAFPEWAEDPEGWPLALRRENRAQQ